MDLHDLTGATGPCGAANVKGIAVQIHVACACNVATIPTPPAYDPATPGASVTIATDITMQAGEYFRTIDVITDRGAVRSALEGPQGSQSFRNSLEFALAGSDPATLAWWEQSKNGCLIAIVTEKTGRKRLIGNLLSPAHYESLEVSNSSEANEGVGMLFDTTGKIAPVYEGVIPLAP